MVFLHKMYYLKAVFFLRKHFTQDLNKQKTRISLPDKTNIRQETFKAVLYVYHSKKIRKTKYQNIEQRGPHFNNNILFIVIIEKL